MEQIKYSTNKTSEDRFHSINCEIEHTGDAKVSSYFEPAITRKDTDEERCDVSFRGRPMNGRIVKLPDNYLIANLKSSKRNEDEFQVNETSKAFTYWNFDQQPDLDDSTYQVVNWLNISEQLNCKVTMEDLAKFDQ